MDDSDYIKRMKVKFRPTGKPERGSCKSTTFEAYCPICKKTMRYFGEKICLNCGTDLDWDFADFEILETIRKGENA